MSCPAVAVGRPPPRRKPLAKLKREAPDLHEQVRPGQATTQAARQFSGSPVDVSLDGLPAGGNASNGSGVCS
jgi:hypothetical protein